MTRPRSQTRFSSRHLTPVVLAGVALFGAACSSTPERSPAIPEVEPLRFVAKADLSASQADAVFLREEAARRSSWATAQPRATSRNDVPPAAPAPEAQPASPVRFEDLEPAAPSADPLAPTFGSGGLLDSGTAAPASGLRRSSATSRPDAIPESRVPLRATPSTLQQPATPTPAGSTPPAPLRNFRDLYRNPGSAPAPESSSRTRRITLAEEARELRSVARGGDPVQSGRAVVRLPAAPSGPAGGAGGQVGWHGASMATKRGPAVDGRQGVMMDLLLGSSDRVRVH